MNRFKCMERDLGIIPFCIYALLETVTYNLLHSVFFRFIPSLMCTRTASSFRPCMSVYVHYFEHGLCQCMSNVYLSFDTNLVGICRISAYVENLQPNLDCIKFCRRNLWRCF